MVVMAPANENECRQMLTTAYRYPGPAAVRYPRGSGPGMAIEKTLNAIPIGKGLYCRMGKNVAILAFGSMVSPAIEAANALDATVVNMRFVKPLDEALILDVVRNHQLIITIEENRIQGGAGSAVNEFILNNNMLISIMNLGLPDQFIDHGNHQQMLRECGLDAEGIAESIQQRLQIPLNNT